MISDVGIPLTIHSAGYVDDMKLHFSSVIKKWGNGGVASLMPQTGSSVVGLVYQLTDHQIEMLDKIEGHMYQRQKVSVRCFNNTLVHANAYIKVKDTTPEVEPSSKYIKQIVALRRTAYAILRGGQQHS